jgi:heme/copper-type cytochrome/quinol oxidase subunit 2
MLFAGEWADSTGCLSDHGSGARVATERGHGLSRLSVTLAASALFAGSAHFTQKSLLAEDSEIRVTARKYEFFPKMIKIKRGDHIRLVITALDRSHSFKLEVFHVDQKLSKGEPVTVEFTADHAGTFPFECSHFCGLGHQKMKGHLIVE